MHLWVIIGLLATVGLLSFLLGLYVAFYFQNQLQVFGQLGNAIPIFSLIGSILVIFELITNWYRQPTLVYDGHITFVGKDIKTVWDRDVPYSSISIQGDLRLFENSQSENHLIFHSNPTQNGIEKTHISYSENDKIEVRIGCAGNVNLPSKPYTKTIREIIESTKPE